MARKEYNVQINFTGKDKLSKTTKGIKSSLAGLASVAGTVATAVAGVGVAVAGTAIAIDKMAGRGGKVIKMRDDFDVLAKTIKSDSVTAMNKLREETLGLVDDYTLMSKASKMMMMGLVDSDDTLAKSIKYAIRFGDVTMSNTEKIDSYVAMLKNSNLMLVDNFGLTRSQVNAKMEELQVTKKLSREQAFSTAVAELLGEKYKMMGDATETSSDSFGRLKATLQNLYDSVLIKLEPMFGAIADVVDDINMLVNNGGEVWQIYREKLQPLISILSELWSVVVEQIEPALENMGRVFNTFIKPAIDGLIQEFKELYKVLLQALGQDGMQTLAKILGGVVFGAIMAVVGILWGLIKVLHLIVWGVKTVVRYMLWWNKVLIKAYRKMYGFGRGVWAYMIRPFMILWRYVKLVIGGISRVGNSIKGVLGRRQLGGALGSGVTLVGERGPELMVGNRIIPANETRSRLKEGTGKSINVDSVNIYNNTDFEVFLNKLSMKLQ